MAGEVRRIPVSFGGVPNFIFGNTAAWPSNVFDMSAGIRGFFSNKFVKGGLPFFTFMLVGVVGLKQFTSIRYEFSQAGRFPREDIEKAGIPIKKQKEVTLETEYEKIKEVDIENWKNIRAPRPWDENAE